MLNSKSVKRSFTYEQFDFLPHGIFDTQSNKLTVSIREDGYWSAAEMCQLCEKPFAAFLRRRHTQKLAIEIEASNKCTAIEEPLLGVPESYVYFLLDTGTSLIKIGYSSQFDKRLEQLRAHTSSSLVLLKLVPGGFNEEQSIHRQLSHLRVHHEWFSFDNQSISFMKQCSDEPPIWIHRCLASNLAGWLNVDFQALVYDYIFNYQPKLKSLQNSLGTLLSTELALLEHRYNQSLYRLDSAGLIEAVPEESNIYQYDWEIDTEGEDS